MIPERDETDEKETEATQEEIKRRPLPLFHAGRVSGPVRLVSSQVRVSTTKLAVAMAMAMSF